MMDMSSMVVVVMVVGTGTLCTGNNMIIMISPWMMDVSRVVVGIVGAGVGTSGTKNNIIIMYIIFA